LPKIRFTQLPPDLVRHLTERVRERKISIQELQRIETWKASEPEAPKGQWYKDFGSFKLCGEGEFPKTVLADDMQAYGEEIE
jgi:hypothetical protein